MLATDQVLHKGRYRIINSFSQDSSGGVYEAYDTVSNTNVVLRESIGNLGKVATSTQVEAVNLAFAGGAKVLTEIKHESLAHVQDYFADIDRQYLVLEPIAGSDLSKFLEAGEQRPALSDVLAWADQLLDALQYLHTRPTPIIHGDVRPENVKLTSRATVKLLTASAHSDISSDLITLAPNRSAEDSGVNYRPLEQLWDGLDALSQRVILNNYDEESERWLLQPLSAATDLYSLGATLYSVLTGAVPPDALDRSIAALEGKADPLRDLTEVNSGVPAEIAEVIMKAMSLRREDRFYSAVILRQILRTAATRAKVARSDEHGIENEEVKSVLEPDLVPTMPTLIVDEAAPIAVVPMAPTVTTTEARQLDIEAERARLEKERLELEERQRELDAELERQKAEQESLTLEAEKEARQKREQERLALESERERERLENEQKELEAAKAKELAEKVTSEQSSDAYNPVDEDEEDPLELLEVPDLPAKKKQVTETVIEPKTTPLILNIEDIEPAKSKFSLVMVAVAVVLVAAAVFGVLKFTSSGTPAAATSVTTQQVSVPTQTDVQPVVSTDRAATEPTQSVAADQPQNGAVTDPAVKENKPVQLNAIQDRVKKPVAAPAPAAAKSPAPKKKVTVDDLINDH